MDDESAADGAVSPPARAKGRPSRADAQMRRDELVEIAARQFLAHGYAGTSIDGIASAARVSKATIYARFGSKENLFAEIGLHSVAGMRSDLSGIPTQDRAPEDVLNDFALRIAGEVAEPSRIALLRLAIGAKDRFPQLAQRLHDHIADTISPLTLYLEALRTGGMTGIDDPARLAVHFIGMANGGLRFLLTDDLRDPAFRQHWAREVSRLFLTGISG